jgi:hypothetical protein
MPLEGVFGIELLERDAWRELFEAADFRVHHGGAVLLRPVRCECWDEAAEEMKGSKAGPSSSAH